MHAYSARATLSQLQSPAHMHDTRPPHTAHGRGYTLAEIEATLAELKLNFGGFRLPVASLRKAYRTRFPDDPGFKSFQNWRAFESAYAGSLAMFELTATLGT